MNAARTVRTLAAMALTLVAAAPAGAARLVPAADGLREITDVVIPAGDGRMFVAEQQGTVRIVEGGVPRATPFLDIRDRVRSGGEQGLLGLEFHPRFAGNGRFYVNYVNRSGNTVIAEFRAVAGASAAAAATGRRLMLIRQPYSNHNGGQLRFGPDGLLYIGMGDGGNGGDPQNVAQRLNTRLGKMLRIDVDARTGRLPYGIPAGNPYRGRAGVPPEILAVGLRNPWRFSFDRLRGDLWIGDVGQSRVEEIDYVPLRLARGANFGWRRFEGPTLFSPSTRLTPGRLIRPVTAYGRGVGCSVTGGYVYRGPSIPGLDGRYVFSDFCSSRVWTLRAGPAPGARRDITGSLGVRLPFGVRTFGQAPDGTLYVATGDAIWRFTR